MHRKKNLITFLKVYWILYQLIIVGIIFFTLIFRKQVCTMKTTYSEIILSLSLISMKSKKPPKIP